MSTIPSQPPTLGKKHRLLLRVERFGRERYGVVFAVAALLLVGGLWLGSRLKLESNLLSLVPAGHVQVDAFKEALSEFGAIDYLMVLVEAGEGQGPDDLEDFADAFADELSALDQVNFVEYRFRPDAQFLELLYQNALLFLPPERLDELAEKLSDRAIHDRLRQIRLEQASPTATFTQELARTDPLGLMPLFLNRLLGRRGELSIDLADGYYLSSDHRTLLMMVKPTAPSQDLGFDERLLAAVRQAESRARGALADAADPAAEARLGVRYGGNYAVAMEEARLIREDIRFNLMFSLFAVSALYFLCYRRFAALLYSSLPLLVGQAMTFGLAFFVLGGLNASSSAFTALLMGLGTDFVIVSYARYIEERRLGRGLAEATESMIGETGLGVFTGAITSAGTFYAMCISEFRGLRDLGFLIGSGILMCAVVILFMLPAMIKWNEGVRRRKVDALTKLHLQSFGLEHLMSFSVRHNRFVVVVIGALTVVAGVAALRIEFDDTINALRSNRSRAFAVQREIAERFGASLSYMMAIAHADTTEDALKMAERVEQRLRPFVESGTVASYDSILTYLPPESQQRRILDALAADRTGAFDPVRIRRSFVAGAEEAGLRVEAFSEFLNRMEHFVSPARPLSFADLEQRGLGRLLERYVRSGPEGVRVVTYLYTADPRWKRDAPPGLAEALTGGDPAVVVTGINVVNHEFRKIFMREAPRAVLLGLIVVSVLLWIDFRSLRLTGIAMAQLLSGVVLMLGTMKLVGVHLNYVNAFVATMILGVGIDYSIHIVHRLSASDGVVDDGLLETGKAVVLAALTNVAGFGTLMLGNYPALRSFGVVAMFGSVCCLLTALTLVPALMARPGGR